MKTKKLLALGISAAMLLSLAGCGSSSAKKYSKALDKIGFEEIKGDELDDFEDYQEDGFYASTTNPDDIEDFCKATDMMDEDDVSSLLVAMRSSDAGDIFMFMSVDFKDEDAASDFMDDMITMFGEDEASNEGMSDYVTLEYDKKDDSYQLAYIFDASEYDVYMEEYMDIQVSGKSVTVFVVLTMSADASDYIDDMETFYKEIGSKSPSSLL